MEEVKRCITFFANKNLICSDTLWLRYQCAYSRKVIYLSAFMSCASFPRTRAPEGYKGIPEGYFRPGFCVLLQSPEHIEIYPEAHPALCRIWIVRIVIFFLK